jgi:hypothetical protein
MPKRLCLTKAGWAKFHESYAKQNDAYRDQQSRGGMNSNN